MDKKLNLSRFLFSISTEDVHLFIYTDRVKKIIKKKAIFTNLQNCPEKKKESRFLTL